jgi:predicted DNA-binding transcriptional regulator AlpA
MKIATKKQQAYSPRHKSSGTDTGKPQVGGTEVIDTSSKVNCTQNLPASKKQEKELRKLATFARELAIIKAQCDAGMEPAISIAATCYMSKRSHATIYRDIQKRILPLPMKIGRNSALPFSVVKAYATGKLVGGTA